MDKSDIDNRFTYHVLKATQKVKYEEIRELARNYGHRLNELCPDSREKSLAFTALEDAVFWANAAIARNDK